MRLAPQNNRLTPQQRYAGGMQDNPATYDPRLPASDAKRSCERSKRRRFLAPWGPFRGQRRTSVAAVSGPVDRALARGRIGGWPVAFLCALSMVAVACDDGPSEDEAQQSEQAPLLGTGELALTLRHGDAPPPGAVEVFLTPAAMRAAPMPEPLALSAGWSPEATAALKEAVSGQPAVLLQVHANTSYRSLSGALSAIQDAGVSSVSFAVRGAGADGGALTPAAFKVVPKSPDEGTAPASMEAASGHMWDDFVTRWEAVEGACRGGKTASCAYKPEAVQDGGALKIVLSAVGQGHTVGFMRLGEPAPPPAKKKRAKRRKVTDPAAELEQEPPAEMALFQWRAHEATTAPSPISDTVKPICGAGDCSVVVRAEAATLAARVLSLLGAAFPDGSPAPSVLFEQSP